MKDATHIANVIKLLIENLEEEMDGRHKCTGVVDIIFFDGASNVQNAGKPLSIKHHCINVGHGAEHVVSLFFCDVFNKVSKINIQYILNSVIISCLIYQKVHEFQIMSEFTKKCL